MTVGGMVCTTETAAAAAGAAAEAGGQTQEGVRVIQDNSHIQLTHLPWLSNRTY
jgi:hypothetical protein